MKVYLGGTYFSDWRDKFAEELSKRNIDFYNPVKVNKYEDLINLTEKDEEESLFEIGSCNVYLTAFVPSDDFYSYPDIIALQNVITMLEEAQNYVCIFYICNNYRGKTYDQNQMNILYAPVEYLQAHGIICFSGNDFDSDIKSIVEFISNVKEVPKEKIMQSQYGQVIDVGDIFIDESSKKDTGLYGIFGALGPLGGIDPIDALNAEKEDNI